MKRKKYLYHIAFFYENNGIGSALLTRNYKINSIADYNDVTEYLKKRNNLTKIVIFNINLLGRTREYE